MADSSARQLNFTKSDKLARLFESDSASTDQRQTKSTKSTAALINAFNRLVVTRHYQDIHVAEIISEADVSRSTFYEHFRNKEDILRHSISAVLSVLATAGFSADNEDELACLLNHICEFETFTKIYFNTDISAVLAKMMSEMIEEKLVATQDQLNPPACQRTMLLAAQIAESNLGLIRAWLNDDDRIDAKLIANQMCNAAKSLSAIPISV